MKKPNLSIIIPFYNEENSIKPILKEFKEYSKKYNFELIIVNNGSTDSTFKILKRIKKNYRFLKVVNVLKNKGYGYGILKGIFTSKSDVIAWTHSDMQTKIDDIFRAYDLYLKLNNKNVLIKGKRIKRELTSTFLSMGMSLLASVIYKYKFSEINAQPKLFHKSFIKYLSNAPYDFSLDLYTLYQAKKDGISIYSINVLFYKRQFGKSKWAYSLKSKWSTILRTIIYMYRLKRNIGLRR